MLAYDICILQSLIGRKIRYGLVVFLLIMMVLVNAILQTGLSYSLDDDHFYGGRTFEAANARLIIRGMLDGRFFYQVQVNMVAEPNLLDLFIGYRHSDALRISAGAHKPKQSAGATTS